MTFKHIRTHGYTQFSLYFSYVHVTWVYRHTNLGEVVEDIKLYGMNEDQASENFFFKILSYCNLHGLDIEKLRKG